MNFNNLYYFKKLAEYEHYAKASQQLYITQPSLSHSIASLEKELGVPLFEKDGRNIRLTKYGKLLNSYLSKGFDEIELGCRILEQFSKKESGIIDLGFIFVLGYNYVPALIKGFFSDGRHEKITIHFNQCNTETNIENIISGKFDISLCAYIPGKTNVNFIPVLKQDLVCITALEHPLAKKKTLEIEDIIQYPMINYADVSGEIQERINSLFEDSQKPPEVFCIMEEEVTMAGLVSSNHSNCIAIVPDLPMLENFPIKKIKINHSEAYRYLYVVTSKVHPMVPCVKLFYDYIINFNQNLDMA